MVNKQTSIALAVSSLAESASNTALALIGCNGQLNSLDAISAKRKRPTTDRSKTKAARKHSRKDRKK